MMMWTLCSSPPKRAGTAAPRCSQPPNKRYLVNLSDTSKDGKSALHTLLSGIVHTAACSEEEDTILYSMFRLYITHGPHCLFQLWPRYRIRRAATGEVMVKVGQRVTCGSD
eukprot:925302-Amphidinium_carterae.1